MSGAAVIGSTGLVGSNILATLLSGSAFTAVHTISRRAPKATGDKLDAIVEPETEKWASKLSAISPVPSTVFSALGTTRAQAGSIANQWKIDHDVNVELAKAAKAAGTKTFVFISSAGIRSPVNNMFPYPKMKIGVEDAIKDLAFDQAIILRPALIMGQREVAHTGGSFMETVVRGFGYISPGLQDKLGQDADVIGRAAVRAAELAAQGKAPSKYWIVDSQEICKLGRPEAQKTEA